MTNGQLSLKAAIKRLISKILSVLKEIEIDEERSLRGYPRLLQAASRAFANIKCTITIHAAQMIEPRWKELLQALIANESIEDSPRRYQVLLGFGLPCKHVLKQAFDTGEPIPRSLIHPRYWLQGRCLSPAMVYISRRIDKYRLTSPGGLSRLNFLLLFLEVR